MRGLTLRNVGYLGSLGGSAIPISDDFNRTDSTVLGAAPVGGRTWEEWVGNWDISQNRIRAVSGANPLAVIDGRTGNVNVSANISQTGRDAIVFRASDPSNWLRLSRYQNQTSSTSCSYIYTRTRTCTYNQGGYLYPQTFSACGTCPSCPSYNDSYLQSSTGCSNGAVCSQSCSSSTSYSYRVYLDKMVNGSLQLVNYWTASSSQSSIKIVANGSAISAYQNASLLGSVTEPFNQTATYHGVGRSERGNLSASALDNFALLPL